MIDKFHCSLCKKEAVISFWIVKGQPKDGYMLQVCKDCEEQVMEFLFQEMGWKD